jgi:trans-aconitate 2-methyltransferase
VSGEPTVAPPGWAGRDYAMEAGHHRTFDDWFLSQHPPGPRDRVVDAGCGSGEFTARLAHLVPEGHVVGVEPDRSMLAAAGRHEAPNLEFRQGRFQELDRVCGRASADLVVSRAVLHWLPLGDYRACFAAARSTLRPGGWLHVESGGAGNVERLRAVLDDVAAGFGVDPARVSFPDPGVVLELLEEVGFDLPVSWVSTVAQRRSFDRDQLLGFVRTQASMAYDLGPSSDLHDRFVAVVGERLEELRRHDGSFDQTFVRLHVLCRRAD